MCRLRGIKNQFTTTYHPQISGQAEWFNRSILAALRHYAAGHPTDWDMFTDALTHDYNTHPNTTTGVAPFELVFSRPSSALAIEDKPTFEVVLSQQIYYEK